MIFLYKLYARTDEGANIKWPATRHYHPCRRPPPQPGGYTAVTFERKLVQGFTAVMNPVSMHYMYALCGRKG